MSIRSSTFAVLAAAALLLGGAQTASAQTPGPQRPVTPGPVRPVDPRAPAAQPQPAAAPPTTRSDDGYVLGADDVVEVEALGHPDFRQRSKIGVDGNIVLPYIGSVPASKKTTLQLAADVKVLLEKGGYFIDPIMRVDIVSYASRYVTVLGNVGSPGLVPVDRQYRLSEILARVGGARGDAADYIEITSEKGDVQRLSIRAAATGDPANDPVVPPGSRLYVPLAELIYLSGQVRAPGGYPVTSDMTVRTAIAKAGGLTDIGSEKSIKVTHKDGKVEKPGMNGKVVAGDVIAVGERLF